MAQRQFRAEVSGNFAKIPTCYIKDVRVFTLWETYFPEQHRHPLTGLQVLPQIQEPAWTPHLLSAHGAARCCRYSVGQSCLTLRPRGLAVARQAPLSMGFPRQEHEWGAVPSSRGAPPPRDGTRVSCPAGGFPTTEPPGGLKAEDDCGSRASSVPWGLCAPQ